MRNAKTITTLLALLLAAAGTASRAEPKTVCTITVNSPDEKEALRQRLPPGQYQFVELVQRGRRDWLRSACEQPVQCDALVVSGHFNAGDTFYSDRVDGSDHLSIDELERASCSGSCPALFARLKEVYLFGCESLNPDSSRYSSADGESGRDRMRRIFAHVPVIYGFSASAPVGPTAAMLLGRYFDAGGAAIGTGHPSPRLLDIFARNNMTMTHGAREPHELAERERICRYFDARTAPAHRLAFVAEVMRSGAGGVRANFERIDRMLATLTDAERASPEFALALAEISADDVARDRFLAAMRAAVPALLRARMIALAGTLGWLSPEGRRSELVSLINAVLAGRSIGYAEVDLACSLDEAMESSGELANVRVPANRTGDAAAVAILACLGSSQAHTRTLAALASDDDRDVQAAQAYLRRRPVSDAGEIRAMAFEVGRMKPTGAQVRALDTLARLRIADRETLEMLTRSFAASESTRVQDAIAGIFLRADAATIAQPYLLDTLRRNRIKSTGGEGLVDVLIRHIQSAQG